MEIKAILKIDLLGDPTPKQSKGFYQELSLRNWQKMDLEEEKFLIIYNDLLSYEEALETIKKELLQAALSSGISRYAALLHFEESNMVVFFCGKNPDKEKTSLDLNPSEP